MGGVGSGTYCRWDKRDTIEERRRVSIGYLYKQGMLAFGAVNTISWTLGSESRGTIVVKGYEDWVVFCYTLSVFHEGSESIEQRINIECTSCNFGGSRPWFTCPECQQRVGLLVQEGKYFLCRKCCDLPYASQTEDRGDRAARRIRNIQKKLGNPDWENVLEPWFPKPKGMHWTTYNKIIKKAEKPLQILEEEAESRSLIALVKWL